MNLKKMKKMGKVGKLTSLVLIGTVALSLAACGANGTKTTNNTTETSKMDGMSNEPKNLEEATSMYKEYLEQENAILAENKDLWEKVFMSADKGMTLQEDGKTMATFFLRPSNQLKINLQKMS